MAVPPDGQHGPGVSDVVEAFESALARGDRCEVSDFAPGSDHPERLAILCELVRVDLEHRWEGGRPRRLEEYRAAFPALFEDGELVRAMAFEEFRLRLQAGEDLTAADYRRRFGLEGGAWPSPIAARSLAGEGPAPAVDLLGPGEEEAGSGRPGAGGREGPRSPLDS